MNDSAPAEPSPDVTRFVADFERAVAGLGFVVARRALLESLLDPEPCWFDHHGGCQGHGYLDLEPGDVCPQAELKAILAAQPGTDPTRSDL